MQLTPNQIATFTWFLTQYPKYPSLIKTASSPKQALLIYSYMHQESIPIHPFSIKPALQSSLKLDTPHYTLQLHAHVIKLGHRNSRHLLPTLLQCYFAASLIYDAQKLFDEMPTKTIAAYNAMLNGYRRMGDSEKARLVFDEMPRMGLNQWCDMINGHVRNGDGEFAVVVFRNMVMEAGLKANFAAVLPVLTVLGEMGGPGLLAGKSVHGFLVRHGLDLRDRVCEGLVVMYGKFRRLESAAWVLTLRKERESKRFSRYACRYVSKGYKKGESDVSEYLQKVSERPNELTFAEVVNACTDSGLVEEGRIYFKLIEGCGVKRSSEHYVSVIQQYCDAGFLEEAYKVIKRMKLESDVVVWCSLLSACEKHKQIGMAEKVALEVMKTMKADIKDGAALHSLVQLYCNAYMVIQNMNVEPDVEVWHSFISACKEHRQFELAEKVAKEIMMTVKPGSKRAHVLPLVQLFSDAGLLEEAKRNTIEGQLIVDDYGL